MNDVLYKMELPRTLKSKKYERTMTNEQLEISRYVDNDYPLIILI